jgi:pyruvate formate lyase activating enzyme
MLTHGHPRRDPGGAPSVGPPEAPDGLRIGGLAPLTSLDFPGELAAVVFCQGCPWRCPYCHNGPLVAASRESSIAWPDIERLLERRIGLLDAVVFSGGEPTLQRDLPAAVTRAKAAGFKIGLHTAGCYPKRLEPLLPLLDWVGLDIKALPPGYPSITGVPDSGAPAWESLEMLLKFGTKLEVRTTLPPVWTLPDDIAPLMRRLAEAGVTTYAVQACRTRHTLDPSLRWAWGGQVLDWDAVRALGQRLFQRFILR